MEDNKVDRLEVTAYIELFKNFTPEEQAKIRNSGKIIMDGITWNTYSRLPNDMQQIARLALFLADQTLTVDTLKIVIGKYNKIKDLCCGGFFNFREPHHDSDHRVYLYPAKDSTVCDFRTINDGVGEDLFQETIVTKDVFFERIEARQFGRIPYLCKSLNLASREYIKKNSDYVSILDIIRSPNMDEALEAIGWM